MGVGASVSSTLSVTTWVVCGLLLSWLAPWALLGLVLGMVGVAAHLADKARGGEAEVAAVAATDRRPVSKEGQESGSPE